MRFGIWTILYVLALLAAAVALFGTGGLKAAVAVLAFWAIVIGVRSCALVVVYVFLLFLVFAFLLLPPVISARPAAPRNQCINNLKQISLALQEYHDVYGSFPPAYIADENGRPMHSWRVLILPYMEENMVYDVYDFNESWDRQSDSRLAATAIDTFRCPTATATTPKTHTNYLAVVGPKTAWPEDEPLREGRIVDGTSNTLLLIESHQHSVHWMEPRDVSFDEAVEVLSAVDPLVTFEGHQPDDMFFYYCSGSLGRSVAYADCHVEFVRPGIRRSAAAALLTKAGGEPLGNEEYSDYDPIIIYRLNWSRVCTLSVFMILALLPLPWAWRVRRNIARADIRRIDLVSRNLLLLARGRR